MLFNSVINGDGTVKIVGPERLSSDVMRPIYYTLVLRNEIVAKPNLIDIIDDAMEQFCPASVTILRDQPPITLLINSPGIIISSMQRVPFEYLWPLCTKIKGDSRLESRITTDNHWIIGKYHPRILTWGFDISYTTASPSVAGIYFGTIVDGSVEKFEYYPANALSAGICEFVNAAENVDVVITNSLWREKVDILTVLASKLNVALPLFTALFTSVEEILKAHIPGLNWRYTKVVESWIHSVNGRLQLNFTPGWSDDFTEASDNRRSDTISDDMEKWKADELAAANRDYAFIVKLIYYASLTAISERMNCAISLGVDLRCTLIPEELAHVYCAKHASLQYPQSNIYFSEYLIRHVAGDYNSMQYGSCIDRFTTLEHGGYYIYDACAYATIRMTNNNRDCPSLHGQQYVRHGDFINSLKNDSAIICFYDGIIITIREIPGLVTLFKMIAMYFSYRGIFAINFKREGYGCGPLGTEGSRTPAILLTLDYRLANASETRLSFVASDQTAYKFLVCRTRDFMFEKYLTPNEAMEYQNNRIPIRVTLWRENSEETKYSRTFKHGRHSKYNGPFLPHPHD